MKKIMPYAVTAIVFACLYGGYLALPSPGLFSELKGEQKVTFDAPLTLRFTQSMNRQSVERAFAIIPQLDGNFVWHDSRTLEYWPKQPLSIDQRYRIRIKKQAQNRYFKHFKADKILTFVTTGPPFVEFVSPHSDGESPIVTEGQIITVMFDRPMALEEKKIKDILQIEPEVKGDLRQTGQSVFQFIPEKWAPATRYTLTIPKGIPAIGGGQTNESFTWEIQTPAPKVFASYPDSGYMGINESLILEFNQEIDLGQVKPGTNALLFPSNDVDAGNHKKEDGFFNTEVTYAVDPTGAINKKVLVFKPSFPYLPNQKYRFVLQAGIKGEEGALAMSEDFELIFMAQEKTESEESEITKQPSMAWANPKQIAIFSTEEPPVFNMQRVKGDTPFSVAIEFCTVSQADFFETNERSGWADYRCINPQIIEKDITSMNMTIDLAAWFKRDFTPGMYFIALHNEENRITQPFLVSNSLIYFKKSATDILVWVLNRKTGVPIKDMALTLLSKEGQPLVRGVTDENGIYTLERELSDKLYVLGQKKGQWALVSELWPPSSYVAEKGQWINFGEPRLYFSTDKNAYWPGEQLHFHGFYRLDQDAKLSLPTKARINIALKNRDGKLIEKLQPFFGNYGAFYGNWEIPMDVQTGWHELTATIQQGQETTDFQYPVMIQGKGVNPFEIQIANARADYKTNESIELILKSSLSSGGVASRSKGHWILKRTHYIPKLGANSALYSFGNQKDLECLKAHCEQRDEWTHSESFFFDERGEMKLVLDPEVFLMDSGYRYTLEVTAEYDDGSRGNGRVSFVIHPGEFYVGLSAKNNWIYAGGELAVNIGIFDWLGHPLSEKKATILLQKKEKDDLKTIEKETLTTDGENNTVTFQMDANGQGYYWIRGQSYDDKRELIETIIPVYIASKKSNKSEKVQLIPDKTEYLVGGKASVLIVPPEGLTHSGQALITYERGSVLRQEIIRLDEEAKAVEFFIDEGMMPNMFVSIALFDEVTHSMTTDTVNLIVSHREKEIKVDMTHEIIMEEDQAKALIKLHTYDYQKRPIPAQVVLQLVGKNTSQNPLDVFYTHRALQVHSVSNDNGAWKKEETGHFNYEYGGSPEWQNDKTIYFNATVKTDEGGVSQIEIPLPNHFARGEVTAIATSDVDQFGMGAMSVKAQESIVIQPDLPEFVTVGDQLSIGAWLINQSDRNFETKIELIADGISIKGSEKKEVIIESGQKAYTRWDIEVLPEAKKTFPVAFRTRETFSVQNLTVKSPWDKSHSLESLIGESLMYFIENGEIKEGHLKEIQNFRKANGGYGLWKGEDKASPWWTAYTLWTLNQAGQADQNAIDYLWEVFLENKDLTPEEQIFILWALSETGQYDTKSTLSLFKLRGEIPLYSYGFLLLNLDNLIHAGQNSLRPFVERLKSELAGMIIEEENTGYFEETAVFPHSGSNERITSIVLMALNRLNPENPILPLLTNYLMAKNSLSPLDRFDTQTSVWKLLSLKNYFENHPPVTAAPGFDEMLSVYLNTESVAKPIENENVSGTDTISISRGYWPLQGKTFAGSMKEGELYRGRLFVLASKDMSNVLIEEPLPAGIKVLSFAPEVTDPFFRYQQEELANNQGYNFHPNPVWNFSHHEIQPDRLIIFAEKLPAGVYTIDFLAEAARQGKFNHFPARIYSLFNPQVFGETKNEVIEIK